MLALGSAVVAWNPGADNEPRRAVVVAAAGNASWRRGIRETRGGAECCAARDRRPGASDALVGQRVAGDLFDRTARAIFNARRQGIDGSPLSPSGGR